MLYYVYKIISFLILLDWQRLNFYLIGKRRKMYKTELIGYTPVAKKMAKKIEDKCNEMEKDGYVLISTTITLGAKAILVFNK